MTQSVASKQFPRLHRLVQGWVSGLTRIGNQAQFYGKTLSSVGAAFVHYKAEMVRLIAGPSGGEGSGEGLRLRRLEAVACPWWFCCDVVGHAGVDSS